MDIVSPGTAPAFLLSLKGAPDRLELLPGAAVIILYRSKAGPKKTEVR